MTSTGRDWQSSTRAHLLSAGQLYLHDGTSGRSIRLASDGGSPAPSVGYVRMNVVSVRGVAVELLWRKYGTSYAAEAGWDKPGVRAVRSDGAELVVAPDDGHGCGNERGFGRMARPG